MPGDQRYATLRNFGTLWWSRCLLLTLIFSLVTGCVQSPKPPQTSRPVEPNSTSTSRSASHELMIGQQLVTLSVASTPSARARGLSGRSSLGRDEGMIFLYPGAAERSFWMADCLIGLDIAFLDASGRILNVESLAPPAEAGEILSVSSRGKAQFVVELRRGWFAEHGLSQLENINLSPAIQSLAATCQE